MTLGWRSKALRMIQLGSQLLSLVPHLQPWLAVEATLFLLLVRLLEPAVEAVVEAMLFLLLVRLLEPAVAAVVEVLVDCWAHPSPRASPCLQCPH